MNPDSLLRSLERSPAFSWDGGELRAEVGAMLVDAGFVGQRDPSDECWIFDHIPKTGGSEFAALAERRLAPNDHLYVRWPASWYGVLIGRVNQVALVHGHGAAYAEVVAPRRRWRHAVCLREPLERTMSAFQQDQLRPAPGRGAPPSFEVWLTHKLAGYPDGLALNDQARWLASVRSPSIARSRQVVRTPVTLSADDTVDRALARLDRCELLGTPESVGRVFERLARTAELRVRAERETPPPANASPVPSRELLEGLSDDMLDHLRELTALDAVIYQRAQMHPGWVA